MIEVGEDVTRCVYCRMPDRAYSVPIESQPGQFNVGSDFALDTAQEVCTQNAETNYWFQMFQKLDETTKKDFRACQLL